MKLHIKSKIITLHDKKEVLDENDNVVYEVSSKFLSITDKTYITNAEGNDVAYIHAKLLSLHNKYYVEMANGTSFELSEELGHLTKDIINIEELGLTLRGDFFAHDYEIVDNQTSRILATARIKWISVHDMYLLDIEDDSQADLMVAIFVTLNHIATQKRINSSHNPSSTSGN